MYQFLMFNENLINATIFKQETLEKDLEEYGFQGL